MEGARPADAEDIPRVAQLVRQALDEKTSERGGELFRSREARAEPIEESLAAELADPDGHVVLVGTVDGVVVGYATAEVETLRTGDRLGRILEVYVEAGARSVGVGEALMDALLAWLRARGCAAVDAMALPGDRETKNFFETAGFTARLLVMHHRFEP